MEMPNAKDMKDAQMLSEKRLQELSKDPANIVYTYEYDTPEKPKAAPEVKVYYRRLKGIYTKIRREYPGWDDSAVRDHVRETDAEMKDFEQSHPAIFKALTDRTSKPEHLQHILYMVYLLEMVENGRITKENATEHAKAFLVEQFKRGEATEEEIKRAKADGMHM